MKSFSSIIERLGIGNQFLDTGLDLLNLGRVERKDLRSMKRFLFLQYDTALGSVLNTTPVFEALRRAIPDAYIAVAASGFPYAILKSNPYIDEVYKTPSGAKEFPKALRYYLRHMRNWRHQFDCVVTDSFNQHTKLTMLQIASGVPVRAGYANRGTWVHHPLAMSKDHNVRIQTSVIENNLRILELLEHPSRPIEPSMFFDESDRRAAETLLQSERVLETGPLIILVTQGSGAQPVDWFDDRFAEVCNRLFDRYQARLIFVGAARDVERIDAIRKLMRAPSFNFAGKTEIPPLAALLCQADLMISVDTGVMHLARAVRLPMVLLASSYQTTKEWLPTGMDRYLILRRDYVPCALCWKSFCATRECMQEISIDDVLKAVETQFKLFPPSAEQRMERTKRATAQNRSRTASAPTG